MKIKDFIKTIDKTYPNISQMDFDNSGANIVDFDADIEGVLVCLDATLNAINYAHKNNLNLIVTHHPFIFNAIKNINDDPLAKRIKQLIKYNINIYSIHTNFDVNLKNGMAKILRNKLYKDSEIVKESFIVNYTIDSKKYGLGNIIVLKKPEKYVDLLDRIRTRLDVDYDKLSFYNVANEKLIKKIVIIPGSGSSDIDLVIKEKPDMVITSDLKHNQIIDLIDTGISYVDASHYALEKEFVPQIIKYLNKIKIKNIHSFNIDCM